jgi:hypothetical protein
MDIALCHVHVGYVNYKGIKARPSFGIKDGGDGGIVGSIRPQAVNGLGRECDHTSFVKPPRRVRDGFSRVGSNGAGRFSHDFDW